MKRKTLPKNDGTPSTSGASSKVAQSMQIRDPIDPARPNDEATLELLRSASGGDREAWTQLFERHRALMRALVRGRIPRGLRGRLDTEDLMQSAFLALYQSHGSFVVEDGESFRAYLATIVRNKLRDRLRHHANVARDAGQEASLETGALDASERAGETPSVLAEKAERQALVLAKIDELEPDEQDLVWLRCIERATWTEIAAELRLSETTARRHTRRALEKLVRSIVE